MKVPSMRGVLTVTTRVRLIDVLAGIAKPLQTTSSLLNAPPSLAEARVTLLSSVSVTVTLLAVKLPVLLM